MRPCPGPPTTASCASRSSARAWPASSARSSCTEAGYDDFTVYEKADRVGGTWRENTYPGLACDVPSHLYSYSFALNPDWSHRFSPGPEIQRLLRGRRRRARARRPDPLRRRGVARCEFARRPLAPRDRGRAPRRGRRRHRRDRRAAPPAVPRHRGPRRLRRRVLPQRALGPRGRARRRRGSASSAPARPRCRSRRRDRRPRREARAVPAHGAVGAAAGEPARTPTRSRPRSATSPRRCATLHDDLSEAFGVFANAVVDADSPEMQADRGRRASRTSRATSRDPSCASGCARLPRRVQAPHHLARLLRGDPAARTPSSSPSAIERVEPGGVRTADGRLHELDVLVLATGFHADAFMRPMRRRRPRRPDARRGLGPAAERVPVDLDPGLPELLHAERPERPGRQLLADRGRRAAVRLHPAARRAAAVGRVPRDQRDPGRDRGARGRARRGGEEDDLGHRLPELVPRRPRHPRGLAVDVRPLPRGDGRARAWRPTSSARGDPPRPTARVVRAAVGRPVRT